MTDKVAEDQPQHKPPPIRVLQMCAVDFTANQFIRPLADGLRKAGYDVAISCGRGSYFGGMEAAGYSMIDNPVSRSANVFKHLVSIVRTWQLLRRERFDIIHVHTPIAGLIGRIAGALAFVPVRIYTAHGFYFHDRMATWKRFALIALEKLGAMFGHFIMTVSKEDEESARRYRIEREGRIETVLNGVDMERFSPGRLTAKGRAELRDRLGLWKDGIVFGFVGRIVREKGIYEFLEAAEHVAISNPYAQFLVVGDSLPTDRDQIGRKVAKRAEQGVLKGRIAFAGLVEDTAPCLAVMDCFCLPTYREGMPVSLLEAMSMSLPCIATSVRGCREEIVDGVCGWLVPPQAAAPLAERMLWVAENLGAARQAGSAARERVRQMFEIKEVIAHQLAIYGRLCSERLGK